MSLPYIASSLSVLASLSGADMPTAFSPEIKLEANRIGIEQCGIETQQANLIEVAQRGTENVAFTYLMGKQVNELHEDVAVNKPVKDLIYAVQPQAERSEFTSLAVYQDQDQGKEAPMLATQPRPERTEASTLAHKDGGIQNEQWSTAFSSSERTEQTGRNLA
jgi:hypothetical protein